MLNVNKKRLFIALNLAEEMRSAIEKYTASWANNHPGIRWTRADCLHLTLHFLGDVEAVDAERLKLSMQSLENKFTTFAFRTGKVSAFPNRQNPRIVFLDCKQTNGSSVIKLQSLLGRMLLENGLTLDKRPWKPHITIGRVTEGETIELPVDLQIDDLDFTVTSFDLMESKLERSGPVYTVLEKFKLLTSE